MVRLNRQNSYTNWETDQNQVEQKLLNRPLAKESRLLAQVRVLTPTINTATNLCQTPILSKLTCLNHGTGRRISARLLSPKRPIQTQARVLPASCEEQCTEACHQMRIFTYLAARQVSSTAPSPQIIPTHRPIVYGLTTQATIVGISMTSRRQFRSVHQEEHTRKRQIKDWDFT